MPLSSIGSGSWRRCGLKLIRAPAAARSIDGLTGALSQQSEDVVRAEEAEIPIREAAYAIAELQDGGDDPIGILESLEGRLCEVAAPAA